MDLPCFQISKTCDLLPELDGFTSQNSWCICTFHQTFMLCHWLHQDKTSLFKEWFSLLSFYFTFQLQDLHMCTCKGFIPSTWCFNSDCLAWLSLWAMPEWAENFSFAKSTTVCTNPVIVIIIIFFFFYNWRFYFIKKNSNESDLCYPKHSFIGKEDLG